MYMNFVVNFLFHLFLMIFNYDFKTMRQIDVALKPILSKSWNFLFCLKQIFYRCSKRCVLILTIIIVLEFYWLNRIRHNVVTLSFYFCFGFDAERNQLNGSNTTFYKFEEFAIYRNESINF